MMGSFCKVWKNITGWGNVCGPATTPWSCMFIICIRRFTACRNKGDFSVCIIAARWNSINEYLWNYKRYIIVLKVPVWIISVVNRPYNGIWLGLAILPIDALNLNIIQYLGIGWINSCLKSRICGCYPCVLTIISSKKNNWIVDILSFILFDS